MRSKKHLILLLVIMLVSLLVVGCGSKDAPKTEEVTPEETEKVEDNKEPEEEEEADAVTSASIVDNNEDFLKSISKDGNWITALLTDLSFEEELVLEGDGFESNGKPDRKIGLYSTDADKNITSYTLSAPKLTIKSSPARMLNGTFIGDIYVDADNFLLQGMKVEGNVYFTSESAQETFVNEDSEVTGVIELVDQVEIKGWQVLPFF